MRMCESVQDNVSRCEEDRGTCWVYKVIECVKVKDDRAKCAVKMYRIINIQQNPHNRRNLCLNFKFVISAFCRISFYTIYRYCPVVQYF